MERENSQKLNEGVIYIICDGERFLIVKRVKQGSSFFGAYMFPAGRVELDDESELATLKREVMEERGAKVTIAEKVGDVTYLHPNGKQITQHVFFLDIKNVEGEISNLEPEKEELRWATLKEVELLCTTEGACIVFNQLKSFLSVR